MKMNTGQALIDDVDSCDVAFGQCALWWLGQHGFIVKLGRVVCYLDPYLTPDPSRQVAPLLRAEEITNATLVLGTHDHDDHIDRTAWPGIAKASPKASFVVPKLLAEKLGREIGLPEKRLVGIDEDDIATQQGVAVTAVPAAHEFLDVDPATGLHPYLGYILEGNGFRLYHAGDTCIYEGMQAKLRHRPLDLALLPINGRDARRLAAKCIGNMTYQEAADLAGAIRPAVTIPAHYEMFAFNSVDPQLFVDYMQVKYPHLPTCIPRHGERMIVGEKRSAEDLRS
jgi:L-ascorbate metabolism protein UlaG (beta-lactamase superfamily)